MISAGPTMSGWAEIRASKVDTALLADLETWLAAAQIAYTRGDYDVALAMCELALNREPFNAIAWEISMKIRLAERGWEIGPQYQA